MGVSRAGVGLEANRVRAGIGDDAAGCGVAHLGGADLVAGAGVAGQCGAVAGALALDAKGGRIAQGAVAEASAAVKRVRFGIDAGEAEAAALADLATG